MHLNRVKLEKRTTHASEITLFAWKRKASTDHGEGICPRSKNAPRRYSSDLTSAEIFKVIILKAKSGCRQMPTAALLLLKQIRITHSSSQKQQTSNGLASNKVSWAKFPPEPKPRCQQHQQQSHYEVHQSYRLRNFMHFLNRQLLFCTLPDYLLLAPHRILLQTM
jgi:hypothetical protein